MTKEQAIKKIKLLPIASFNQQQKELSIEIVNNMPDNADIQSIFKLLTRRVKTGFVFDEAPEINDQKVCYFNELKKLNINISKSDGDVNKLIIGENYDALKNLLLVQREREREREREFLNSM